MKHPFGKMDQLIDIWYVKPSVLSAYISHFVADASWAYPSTHRLVPASINKCLGADDGSLSGIFEGLFDKDCSLVIDSSLEIEGFDDGSLEKEI